MIGARFVNDDAYPVDPLLQRLFRHMRRQTRGRNLFLMSDGTVLDSQVNGTPPNMILPRTDPYATVWDATSGSLQITKFFQTPYVTAVMYGGSANPVTSAQAAQLTAAGFGSTLSSAPTEWDVASWDVSVWDSPGTVCTPPTDDVVGPTYYPDYPA